MGTFKKYKNKILQRAILKDKVGRDQAQLLESLLIITAKQYTNLENKNFEIRNLQCLNTEEEEFHLKVFFKFYFLIFKILD